MSDKLEEIFERHFGEMDVGIFEHDGGHVYKSDILQALRDVQAEAEKSLMKEIRQFKPYLHFCQDWDGLIIDVNDPEFGACGCFDPKPKGPEGMKPLSDDDLAVEAERACKAYEPVYQGGTSYNSYGDGYEDGVRAAERRFLNNKKGEMK